MSATRSSLFSRLFRHTPTTIRRPKPAARVQLGLTALEARDVPAYLWNGSLIIDGTNYADTAYVSMEPPANWFEVAKVKVVENSATQLFSRSLIRNGVVIFRGNGGNDIFQNSAPLFVYADGGAGRDVLSGGPMDDTLMGGINDDAIYGNDGVDQIWGGQGADEIRGGGGNDILAGDDDNDTIRGGPGNDAVYGNAGHDTMYGDNNAGAAGGVGNDTLYGAGGNDILVGEGGNDDLRGEMDTDYVYGNDGEDLLFGDNAGNPWGGESTDHIYGGQGNDTLYGEGGNDEIRGEAGNDTLFGGNGYDSLYGGDQDDWMETGSWAEYADGGAGKDWNANRWAVDGAVAGDINQRGAGTCAFMAALAGTSKYRDLAASITYDGNHYFTVRMYEPDLDEWVAVSVYFDGSMVRSSAGEIVDPLCVTEGEFWTILYQRAYLMRFRGTDAYNGDAVLGVSGESDGWANRVLMADDVSSDSIRPWIGNDVAPSWLAAAARTQMVTAGGTGHRYMVDEVTYDAADGWLVRLYNPVGSDTAHNGLATWIRFDGKDDGYITVDWDAFGDFLETVWYT